MPCACSGFCFLRGLRTSGLGISVFSVSSGCCRQWLTSKSEGRFFAGGTATAAGGPRVVAAAATGAGLVATGRRVGPRVVAAATGAALALPAAGPGAGTRGLRDLGGGAAQARADLVDVDLEDRALLTLAGLVLPGLQATLDDRAHALLERLGDVLGRLAPHRAGEEERVAVAPLAGLTVIDTGGRRDPEVGDRGTRGGESQLRVVDQISDDGDDGIACHGDSKS